jgi:hypothetical protein
MPAKSRSTSRLRSSGRSAIPPIAAAHGDPPWPSPAGVVLVDDGYAVFAQLSGDWATARSGFATALDGFASEPVVKGLAIAGLSRSDEADGDLESAERRYTDAFKSARRPANPGSLPERSMDLAASLPAAAVDRPSDRVGYVPSAPTAGATGTLRYS